jgi:hypothetical protein
VQETKSQDVGVTSNGIKFIKRFVKISQQIQKLKHRQHGDDLAYKKKTYSKRTKELFLTELCLSERGAVTVMALQCEWLNTCRSKALSMSTAYQ